MGNGKLFKFLTNSITKANVKQGGSEWERFCLFALLPAGKLEEGWVNLHLLLWKQFIALLVRIELEGDKYDEKAIWGPAWARFESKVLALKTRVGEELRRSEARGEEPRDMSKRSRSITPLASFTKEGELVWNDALVKKIKDRYTPEKVNAQASASGGRRKKGK